MRGAADGAGTPVWGAPQPLPTAAALPRRAEVVVVGGGITGVALLGALAERGVSAVLLERDHLASGASGRNAGFLLAGVAENYARAVRRHGRDVAREVWAFTIENHARVAAAAATLDVGYRCEGSSTVAVDAEEAASLEEAATLLAEDGLPGTLGRPGPVPGSLAVLDNPSDGEVDPVRLVRGLASARTSSVFERCRVDAVDDGEAHATVRVHGGTIEAAAVILATNAWTTELVDGLPIRPVRAQMLATAPAAATIRRPVYAEWGHRYWRQRSDGVVLVGGFRNRATAAEVGYELVTTPLVQSHLDGQLRQLGVTAPVTHRWAGTMGFSHDGLALAGLVPGRRRIHLCAGYTGHGMGFAVQAAAALARHIVDSDPLPTWLDVARTA